jgi:glycosyltransferase involved in cell wall biosynthesis
VVIPAYDEKVLIETTLLSIPGYVDKVYAVDDCSSNGTLEKIRLIARRDPRITVIHHEVNGGVGAAIVSGFKRSLEDGVDIAVIMAGDNQMDPQYLPSLLDPISGGEADFTKGNRLIRGYWNGMSPWRLFGNFTLTYLNKIASGYWKISDPQNGYVAISKGALSKLNLDSLCKGYAFENDILIKSNIERIKVLNVKIPARYGKEKSKIKYTRFILKTSYFLFTSFFKRIYHKYVKKPGFIGLLFSTSFFFMAFGIVIPSDNYLYLSIGSLLLIVSLVLDGVDGAR